MPDPIDHATGLEKKELLAALAGNDDPYHMKAIKRGVGTRDKPTLIPSAFDARILGCICKYYANAHFFLLFIRKFHLLPFILCRP